MCSRQLGLLCCVNIWQGKLIQLWGWKHSKQGCSICLVPICTYLPPPHTTFPLLREEKVTLGKEKEVEAPSFLVSSDALIFSSSKPWFTSSFSLVGTESQNIKIPNKECVCCTLASSCPVGKGAAVPTGGEALGHHRRDLPHPTHFPYTLLGEDGGHCSLTWRFKEPLQIPAFTEEVATVSCQFGGV